MRQPIRSWRTRHTLSVVCAAYGLALVLHAATGGDGAMPTLDELLELTPAPPPSAHTDAAPTHLPPDVLRREAMATDLVATLLQDMEAASEELGPQGDPGLAAQRHQEAALAKLDALIEQAKKNRSSSDPGSGEQSGPRQRESGSAENAARRDAPAATGSQTNPGTFSPGSPRDSAGGEIAPRDPGARWGHLPPRVRSELIQARRERFSAHYRALTEDYYRRLAEDEDAR